METQIEITSDIIILLKFIHTGITQEQQTANDVVTFIEKIVDAYNSGQLIANVSVN
jgi:hypothetical protein